MTQFIYSIPIYVEIDGVQKHFTRHVTLPAEDRSLAIARVLVREVAALKRKGMWGSSSRVYVGIEEATS